MRNKCHVIQIIFTMESTRGKMKGELLPYYESYNYDILKLASEKVVL
ncbi:hypothetical protein BCAH1134_C0158 (plasmid) [Bacillus cereus AH1134]|nr:hypothetical protein BCAH1134_C0158 [Bacillus cereus AH1134]